MGMRQESRRRGIGRTLGAFALGATAGSIAALLCAPASGRVTRKRLGMKMRAVQRESLRRLGQTKRMLARKTADLREAAAERVHAARDWAVDHVGNGHSRRRPAPRRRPALRHA